MTEYTVEFYYGDSKTRGKVTVAILTVTETGAKFKGVSHCNPLDKYDKEVGEKIADSRARKQYFKAVANEAYAQYLTAKQLEEATKKYAQKKFNRYAREEKWLADYMKTV